MNMKKLIAAVTLIIAIAALCACGTNKNTDNKASETPAPAEQTAKTDASEAPAKDNAEDPLANQIPIEIDMEDGGVIKAVLYPDIAPITVENFVKLCKENFYDGLIFHRVIKNFMIQGGGYDENFNEKETDSIKGEFKENGVTNRLKHTRGVLSMARTNDPDSASSQFFIMHAAAPSLDGNYAAFGIVTEGMDVVDKIATTETGSENGMDDVPVETQKIKTIKVLE